MKRLPRGTPGSKELVVATAVLVCAMSLVACSSHPEKRLLGGSHNPALVFNCPFRWGGRYTQVRFEFLEDGSVIESGMDSRRKSGWDQKTGTFRPINPTRLKIDLGWAYGTTIYELNWQDNDHVRLRADDQTIELERVK